MTLSRSQQLSSPAGTPDASVHADAPAIPFRRRSHIRSAGRLDPSSSAARSPLERLQSAPAGSPARRTLLRGSAPAFPQSRRGALPVMSGAAIFLLGCGDTSCMEFYPLERSGQFLPMTKLSAKSLRKKSLTKMSVKARTGFADWHGPCGARNRARLSPICSDNQKTATITDGQRETLSPRPAFYGVCSGPKTESVFLSS